MKSLDGKVAVITGAGSGIGREVAWQLAGAGALVAVVDRDGVTAEETAAAERYPGRCRPYIIDVADKDGVDRLAKEVQSDLGSADILVNNAGIILRSRRFDRVTDEDLRRIVDVNLWGVLHCTRAFLPQLLDRPEASLVNVSSLGGLLGFMDQVAYNTVKFAVRGFSESLRMDLHGTGVSVTSVHPGAVATSIMDHCDGYTEDERVAARQRLSRTRHTTARDAAEAIVAGIRKKKGRVLIGPESYVMDAIVRLMPVSYSRLLYPAVKKLMATADPAAPTAR